MSPIKVEDLGTLLPRINVPVPGPKSAEIAEVLARYESTAGSAMILGKVPVAWKYARERTSSTQMTISMLTSLPGSSLRMLVTLIQRSSTPSRDKLTF